MKHLPIKRIILVSVVLFLLAALCVLLIPPSYPAGESFTLALQSDDAVSVTIKNEYIVFSPDNAKTAFIFYPGGRVESTAYSPLLHRLAEEDILCILMNMPMDLAILGMYAAEDIPDQFPYIENWFIGGHSLGGSSAAYHIVKTDDSFSGLVLLASYSSVELQDTKVRVCSIYGSEDGILNLENYQKYTQNLPENFMEIVISGGNHSQFGDYGLQKNDGVPDISAEEQLQITVDTLTEFFND